MDASITIVCGESVQQSFQCNADVLAASSTFFKHLLASPLERDPTTLTVPNIEPDIFERVLQFFATSDSQLVQGDLVLALLSAADYLGAPLLKAACADFLIAHAEPSEYATLLTFGEDHDCGQLCAGLRDRVLRNGSQFYANGHHIQLSAAQISTVMRSDELTVDREEDVWHALLRWLDVDPASRRDGFLKLTAAVRFALFEERNLYEIVTQHFSDEAVTRELNLVVQNTLELLANSPTRSFEVERNGRNRLRSSGFAHGVVMTVNPSYDDTLSSHYLAFVDMHSNAICRLKYAPDTRSPGTPRHPHQVAADADGTLYLLTCTCHPNAMLRGASTRAVCFTRPEEAKLWHYDAQTDEWMEAGVVSGQQKIIGMCIVDKSVYVLCRKYDTSPYLVRYSLDKQQVEGSFPLPCRKVSFSPLLLLDGSIYIFHVDNSSPHTPYSADATMRDTVVFDTVTQTISPKAPSHLWHDNDGSHCVCVTPDRLIYSLSNTAEGTGLERYDPTADLWTLINHDVAVIGVPSAMIYFRGQYVVVVQKGRNRETVTQKVVFDDATGTWRTCQQPLDVRSLQNVRPSGSLSHTAVCSIRRSALETMPPQFPLPAGDRHNDPRQLDYHV